MTLLLTLAAIPFAIAAGQYVRHLIKTVRRIGELGQLHDFGSLTVRPPT